MSGENAGKTFRVRGCRKAPVYGKMRPGDDLVIAGFCALEGSDRVECVLGEKLRERFPAHVIRAMENQRQRCGADVLTGLFPPIATESESPENRFPESAPVPGQLRKAGVTAAAIPGDGGIFAALWDLTRTSGCGFETELRKIPLTQATIEICEFADLNPYRLDAAGCLLLAAECGERLKAALLDKGIPAVIIGYAAAGKAARIHNAESAAFLDYPARDESAKICAKEG